MQPVVFDFSSISIYFAILFEQKKTLNFPKNGQKLLFELKTTVYYIIIYL